MGYLPYIAVREIPLSLTKKIVFQMAALVSPRRVCVFERSIWVFLETTEILLNETLTFEACDTPPGP